MEDLHRDPPVEDGVGRGPDLGHPPGAGQLVEPVPVGDQCAHAGQRDVHGVAHDALTLAKRLGRRRRRGLVIGS